MHILGLSKNFTKIAIILNIGGTFLKTFELYDHAIADLCYDFSEGAPSRLQRNSSVAFGNDSFGIPTIFEKDLRITKFVKKVQI